MNRHAPALLIAILLSAIVVQQWFSSDKPASPDSIATPVEPAITTAHNTLAAAASAAVPSVASLHQLPDDLKPLAEAADFAALHAELLKRAMQAVEQQNDENLANAVALLGLAALEEQDIDTASVYLNEALELYQDIDSELAVASVSLHIGRMHIMERRRARRAALAYDTSLLARWHIAHGNFYQAEASLKTTIEQNLLLNRNGAAAVDYESLYKGYIKQGNLFDAENSALAAARLHAASGRRNVADKLLDELQAASLLTGDRQQYQSEFAALQREYEASVSMLARVRDYNQLYHHYIDKGDPVRAWRFRLKANASQQNASKRARYRRQAGVLVLLYNSNDSMRQARLSLQHARSVFDKHQHPSLAYQSTLLISEVY